MEKSGAEKKGSFSFFRSKEELADDPLPETTLHEILREVDLFAVVLSSLDDKTALPEVPVAAEALPAKVDAMIAKPDGGGFSGDELVDAVQRLASLIGLLDEFTSEKCRLQNTASAILSKAMSFLEKQMRTVMEDYKGISKTLKTKSFGRNTDLNRGDSTGVSAGLGDFPGYSDLAVAKMSKIATAMISAGNEAECGQIYHVTRRKALKSALSRSGFEKLNVDDLQKVSWEVMENQISICIQILKSCAAVFFPAERRLCETIFTDYPKVYHREYTRLGMEMLTRLLQFAGAVPKTKRSTDKLFKFLDLYECFRDETREIEESFLECGDTDLTAEINSVKESLAGAAIMIFGELEKSIKTDTGGKSAPPPNGAVHPSTRYIMNYLKYACEYKNTLEHIFLHQQPSTADDSPEPETPQAATPITSPFAAQLMKIIDLLDESLDTKSTQYKDASLRLVFLMNNGRYILQKIKSSPEIYGLVGETCYRRRSSNVRMYHKNYTRETWGRLLQTLAHQGLQVANGKLTNKALLKERLKNFNHTFEEIQKTQSTWVVSDEQLRLEMRASVAAMVIPAYRSFLGRFQLYLTAGRQVDKYVKFQPDDIETLIEGLFDGNPSAIGKKTKNKDKDKD